MKEITADLSASAASTLSDEQVEYQVAMLGAHSRATSRACIRHPSNATQEDASIFRCFRVGARAASYASLARRAGGGWDCVRVCAEELQDHVEDIDSACDLSKIGGLPPLLALLCSPHASLRAAAAEVLATAVQNNPKAQQQVLDSGAMEPLLTLARTDSDANARLKGLLALGCAYPRARWSCAGSAAA